jgi:hypothetical protein
MPLPLPTATIRTQLSAPLRLTDGYATGESRFDELPGVMARLAPGSLPALFHTITSGEG